MELVIAAAVAAVVGIGIGLLVSRSASKKSK